MIEPGTAQALDTLWSDPRLQPTPGWFWFGTVRLLLGYFGPVVRNVLRALRQPDAHRVRFKQTVEVAVTDFAHRNRLASSLAQRLDLLDELMVSGFALILPSFLPIIAGGMSTLNLLTQLAKGVDRDALMLTRGLPHNVTTEMDLQLWRTAATIQQDGPARAYFERQDAATLAAAYQAGALPVRAQTAVAAFLDVYGMRGVGEIDFGRHRWREDPTQVMQSLQSYLQIPESRAPDAVFARGAVEAETAVADLTQALRHTRSGWLKAHIARLAATRMRALAGVRESPKFAMIRLFGIIRAGLLDSGERLVADGILTQPDDLVFLHVAELRALADGKIQKPALQELVLARRAANAREQKRSQLPRLLLSDGRAFYEGMAGDATGDFVGSPVSPGVVEGRVHVVFEPHGARLQPGDILVCPGTDPAWTPLFLAAGGLVMEVGDMMTHGSVVAREYGIPAVVGVHQATTRLQTGQRIRVDGSAGTIVLLDDVSS